MKSLLALRNATFIALLAAALLTPRAYAYQINATGSNPITFGTGSTSATVTEKLRISSAGLIGIGTATPTTPLTVSGTISATAFVGNGSLLTNIPAGNLSETIAINDLSDASASTVNGSVYLGSSSGAVSTGSNNAAVGMNALHSNTTGSGNVASGYYALYANTSADNNVANGSYALRNNSTGTLNMASGASALNANTTGSNNTASGPYAMYTNSTGTYNAALGASSLFYNTSDYNAALGAQSLFYNTTGSYNAGAGFGSLFSNTTGYFNTGLGFKAGYFNTTGINNTIVGADAGYGVSNSTTYSNGTLVGYNSGVLLTTGGGNTFLGSYSGQNVTTGSSNTLIGYNSGGGITTGSNNLVIGMNTSPYSATGSNQLNIGNAIFGNIGSGIGLVNFIGINVASPTTALQVSGTVNATAFVGDGSGLTNLAGSGSDKIISSTTNVTANSTGYISLTTGNVNTGYFDTAGRLSIPGIGIGVAPTTTVPIYVSNSGTTFGLLLDGSNNYSGVGFYRAGVKQGGIIQEATGNMYYDARTDEIFRTGGNTERMRITSGGNVGIGTNAPTAPLHIYGTSLTDTYMTLGVGTSSLDGLNVGYGGASFGQGASFLNAHSQSGSSGSLRLLVDGTNVMTLTNSKVSIGGNTAPSASLVISTSTLADGIQINSPIQTAIGLAISSSVGQASLGLSGGTNQYANGSLAGDTVLRSLQVGTNTNNLILAALTTSGSISFRTGAISTDVERMRINSNGVGIGPSPSPVAGNNIYLTPQDTLNEGAQIAWGGSNAGYANWITDVYTNIFRIYNTSVTPTTINMFSTAGSVSLGVNLQAAPNVALDVNGAIVSRVFNNSAATSFDWSKSNAQYTTATCGAMTFTNMQDGGTYSLLISSTTVGTCSFTHTGLVVKMPAGHGATTSGKTTLYGFTRFGTNVYTTWQPGY